MAVSGEAQPITMKNKQQRQEKNEHRTQVCMLLFGKKNILLLSIIQFTFFYFANILRLIISLSLSIAVSSLTVHHTLPLSVVCSELL